jgi:ACT domain-containing protein
MAYSKKEKEKMFEKAKEVITENKLIFIEDIVAFLPISKPTFYEFYPVNSNEINELKEMLEVNKVQIKVSIRSKLSLSEKAGELLALYRLVCTPEERQMLNQQYVEMKASVNTTELTQEQIDKVIEKL